MFTIISSLLTGIGMASASGLNAYIPLLILALAARFTNLVQLSAPFDVLTNGWVIGALIVLLAIEVVVDKIPAVDSVNNVFQTVVRPAAGAILFAANTNALHLDPVVAVIVGLVLAFGVHATKSAARPVVTVGTAGLGNALVSLGEDVVAIAVSIVALVVPIVLGLIFFLIALIAIGWLILRMRPRPREID